jgi:two-component system phosphate regulon sensor histidine kinase PhoR
MRRSQLQLLAALSCLVAAVVALFGIQAHRELSAREAAQELVALEAQVELARELLGGVPLSTTPAAELADAAERIAEAAGARVTLIARDGTVVADSSLPAASLSELESHEARPEVRAALSGRLGHDVRRSAAVGRTLSFVALPARAGDGVVRLAVEPADRPLQAALGRWLRGTTLAGLLLAVLLSLALSRSTARSVERMRQVATSVARGDLSQRVRRHSGDELDPIAGAIDQMAEQLRLRLEEATHEKERLQAVLNGMVEGVLVVDTGGKIVLLNDHAREFFAIRGPVEGRSFLEVIRHAELDELISRAAATDEALSGEIQPAGAGERVLRVQAVRFPPGRAARMGTVAVFHDVTALMRLEQVRRDFVANASHELRTPLTAIAGFAETLLSNRNLGEADRRSYLEVIDRHAQRLSHLVSDLLELSKIESRKVPLELRAVDVAALAERLLHDYHERFAAKDLQASVERHGRPVARGDAQAIEQILVNLVDNAVKYTEAGGSVVIRIAEEAGKVAVSVSDTGIGIPAADRERIFERFYRVDKARSRELGGTGLGLSIVKHLVQNQGGEISVESEPGRGSTFRFTLPRDAGQEPG